MNKTTLLATAAIFAATVLTTRATHLTMYFSGTITEAERPSPSLPFHVGDPFTGYLSFDTLWDGITLPILDPSSDIPNDFDYPQLGFVVGGKDGFGFGAMAGWLPGFIEVFNSDTYDSLLIGGDIDHTFFSLFLEDFTGKVITNGPHPMSQSLTLANWDTGRIWINTPGEDLYIGTLSIPDSSNSATLLALGLSGLFFCRSRVKKLKLQF